MVCFELELDHLLLGFLCLSQADKGVPYSSSSTFHVTAADPHLFRTERPLFVCNLCPANASRTMCSLSVWGDVTWVVSLVSPVVYTYYVPYGNKDKLSKKPGLYCLTTHVCSYLIPNVNDEVWVTRSIWNNTVDSFQSPHLPAWENQRFLPLPWSTYSRMICLVLSDSYNISCPISLYPAMTCRRRSIRTISGPNVRTIKLGTIRSCDVKRIRSL
jgi:hypothetical protein